MKNDGDSYLTSLLAGGVAGFVVDMTLFPLDTVKTRLQSSQGFFRAGGFRNVYKGVVPQAIGSAPTAAVFFCTYDAFKRIFLPVVRPEYQPIVYMSGAAVGEIAACIIRVPVEVVKQRKQTTIGKTSSFQIAINAYHQEGLFKGIYRGFGSTVLREIPFALIQFPLWEASKKFWSRTFKNNQELTSWEVSVCGAIAGGISAFLTTPLDVTKTRIMLADKNTISEADLRISNTLIRIYREESLRGLFSGCIPRTMWITLGGAIFFGTYDVAKNLSSSMLL